MRYYHQHELAVCYFNYDRDLYFRLQLDQIELTIRYVHLCEEGDMDFEVIMTNRDSIVTFSKLYSFCGHCFSDFVLFMETDLVKRTEDEMDNEMYNTQWRLLGFDHHNQFYTHFQLGINDVNGLDYHDHAKSLDLFPRNYVNVCLNEKQTKNLYFFLALCNQSLSSEDERLGPLFKEGILSFQ